MLLQFISAVCIVSCIILAMLIMIGIVSPKDACKAIGKGLLMFLCTLMAVCMLRSLLTSATILLLQFLKAIVPWLVVTVFLVTAAMVVLRLLLRRFGTGKENHDGTD